MTLEQNEEMIQQIEENREKLAFELERQMRINKELNAKKATNKTLAAENTGLISKLSELSLKLQELKDQNVARNEDIKRLKEESKTLEEKLNKTNVKKMKYE